MPAAAALALAVLAVSWGSILVRWCDAPALSIAFYRVALAGLALSPWLRRPAAATGPPAGIAIAAAGLLLAVHFATWVEALQRTSVASATLLVNAAPLFVAVLAPWVVGERTGRYGWLGLAAAGAGAALLVGGDSGEGQRALQGDLLALASAAAYAGYLMLGRRVRERVAFPRYLALVNGSAAVWLLLGCVAAGAPLRGFGGQTWLWLGLLAAIPHLLGHGLLNWSVRRLSSLTVTLAALGEPALATIYAVILFAEVPGAAFYGGAALIAAGILLAATEESPTRC